MKIKPRLPADASEPFSPTSAGETPVLYGNHYFMCSAIEKSISYEVDSQIMRAVAPVAFLYDTVALSLNERRPA